MIHIWHFQKAQYLSYSRESTTLDMLVDITAAEPRLTSYKKDSLTG